MRTAMQTSCNYGAGKRRLLSTVGFRVFAYSSTSKTRKRRKLLVSGTVCCNKLAKCMCNARERHPLSRDMTVQGLLVCRAVLPIIEVLLAGFCIVIGFQSFVLHLTTGDNGETQQCPASCQSIATSTTRHTCEVIALMMNKIMVRAQGCKMHVN